MKLCMGDLEDLLLLAFNLIYLTHLEPHDV